MASSKDISEEISFKITKEDWNEYRLNDEAVLRVRMLLAKVFKGKTANEFYFEFIPPIFVVSSPKEKRGELHKEPSPNEYENLPKESITFIDPFEPWNSYLTADNKTISLRYSVSDIKRVKNRYDKNGYPFYIVNGGPAITVT